MADKLRRVSSSDDSSQDTPQDITQADVRVTAALVQNEELSRQILDSSDDCIKVLDLEGRILFMSRGGQALLGIQDITPFLNAPWAELWEGASQQRAIEVIAKARAGEVCTFQGYRPTFSGEPKWWDSKISPIRDAEGQIEQLLCISRDITERRRIENERKQAEITLRDALEELQVAEEELRQQNEELAVARELAERERHRYQDLFNFAPDGYVVTDAQGMIQEANLAIAALVAVDQHYLVSTPLAVYISKPDQRAFRNLLYELHQQSGAQKLQTDELSLQHPEGYLIPVAITGTAIRNAQAQIIEIRWLIQDITDRKLTEEALRQSESRLRLIIESAKEYAIFTLDMNGYITSWGSGAQRLLGYEEAEIIGQLGHIFFTPEDRERGDVEREMQKALAQGQAENERWHVRQDGSRFWASGLMMPLDDEANQVQGFLKIMRDMTVQKQAEAQREQLLVREQAAREEAQKANRLKDEFLAVLSHELRSPLNPILGWSKLLQQGRLDAAKTQIALKTIERNAHLQSELIEDLLDVSRILRGKLSLNVASVNLASTIRAALETVRLAAEAKSITVAANLESDVGLVFGDATRLQQVIWNLLSNAVKFTPSGGQVNIRLEQLDSYAHITVSDTGQGIAPDFLPYVFDYFRQANAATTRKFGGLGLGLAIVRHLVELHGGRVEVESLGVGRGATFTVRLPLLPTPIAGNQDSQLSESPADLSGIQVLVVDDEPDSRELVAFVLEQAGAKVMIATTADEALSTLIQAKPDVLISDIGMPDRDGYMLIQQVRALPPEQGGQVRAIALTAYAGDFNQQQALQAGFQQHVSKPVEPERLIRAIALLLNQT